MARKKVKLAYITNDSARRACFRKRKKGLLKKVSELSTLCDVNACAIIYSPYDTEPEVWPSPKGVQHVLALFKSMPETEQSKKMFDQVTYLIQQIGKAQVQVKNQTKQNHENDVKRVMFQSLSGKSLQGLMLMDLQDLMQTIDQHLEQVYSRMKIIKKQGAAAAADQPMNNVVKMEAP